MVFVGLTVRVSRVQLPQQVVRRDGELNLIVHACNVFQCLPVEVSFILNT
jgi:hypothetical protein